NAFGRAERCAALVFFPAVVLMLLDKIAAFLQLLLRVDKSLLLRLEQLVGILSRLFPVAFLHFFIFKPHLVVVLLLHAALFLDVAWITRVAGPSDRTLIGDRAAFATPRGVFLGVVDHIENSFSTWCCCAR